MKKHTTKALITSLLSMLLCVSMLIGSTFAWFTDTATTGVNTIMSGNLDVALEMLKDGKWVNAEGETLDFVKAAGAPKDEPILWEPGCTYELPKLRVVNKGNLALKYQIQITGINGDAKLNEAIEWTIDGADVGKTYELLADAAPIEMTIKGHMKEEAGNEYKNLTIEGIAITVLATQKDAEYDSFDKDYDATAPQLVSLNDELYDTLDKAIAAAANGDTIKLQGMHTLSSVSNKTITFSGIDGAAVLSIPAGVEAAGSTLAFENLTVQGYDKEDTFYTRQLAHAAKATYTDCTIKGLIVTYCDSDFVDCVFENTFADQYSVFCYGGSTFTITNCTFNTPCSKAVKIFNEGTGEMSLTVEKCKFFASTTDKAAIEIDSTYTAKYTVTIKDCEINEYYDLLVNDKATKSVITVDGTPVVFVKNEEGLKDTITGATGPVEVVLPEGEYTLPALTGKDVTITGGEDTVIDTTAGMPGTTDAALTFEGVTINFKEGGSYGTNGFTHSKKVVYKDCIINGTQFLYASEGTDFINCTFNVTGDAYNVWTYGTNATFTGCTFNCDGKAVLIYTEGAVTNTVEFDDCVFNDNGTTIAGKAAVEIGESAYGNKANYTVKLDGCTVNGFDVTGQNAATFGGTDLGTTLWGNKNLMPADRLNIIVNGTEVY